MGVSRTSWVSLVTPRYQFQTGSGGARQRRQGVWCGGKALAWGRGGRRGRGALLVQNGELCVMGRKKLRNTGIQGIPKAQRDCGLSAAVPSTSCSAVTRGQLSLPLTGGKTVSYRTPATA